MNTIGTKLGISYGVLVGLCVITGAVSYQQTLLVGRKVDEVISFREPENSAVHALRHNLMESAFATFGYLSSGDSTLLVTLGDAWRRLPEIQAGFREVERAGGGGVAGAGVEEGFAKVRAIAEEQITARDLQHRTMQALLRDLDALDLLLAQRIQASVSIEDPAAYRRLQSVLEIKAHVNAITKGVGTFLATGEPQFEQRVAQAESGFEEYFRMYRNVLLSSEEKGWSEELRRLSTLCMKQAKSVVALDKERRARLSEYLRASLDLASLLESRIVFSTEPGLETAKADLLQAGKRANTSILIALLGSLVFSLVAGFVTTKSITGPIRSLSSTMLAIARGERAEHVAKANSAELHSLGEAFTLMTGKLRDAESARLAALRRFAQSVQKAQEEERARIARELHDDLCQRLSGTKFMVEVLEEEIDQKGKRPVRRLEEVAQELDRAIIEVRRIASNLRPSVLDDFGLVTALKMLCRDFQKKNSVTTTFEPGETPSREVDPSIEIALYRIAQEALSNIAKYAGATTVRVELLEDDLHLSLIVRDNGRGFNHNAAGASGPTGSGFGLSNMRERTELLGGTFTIDSQEGTGTAITSMLPLRGFSDNAQDQNSDRG